MRKLFAMILTGALVASFLVTSTASAASRIPQIGVLSGHFNYGPICPVITIPPSCDDGPALRAVYRSHEIKIWLLVPNQEPKLVRTARFNYFGNYFAILPAGNYKLDLWPNPWGTTDCDPEIRCDHVGSSNVPANVSITGGQITRFDINVDTGIR